MEPGVDFNKRGLCPAAESLCDDTAEIQIFNSNVLLGKRFYPCVVKYYYYQETIYGQPPDL